MTLAVFTWFGARVAVMKLAMANVSPPNIVTVLSTVPASVFEQESVIGSPSMGALAGEPLESCSWTTMAG